MTQMKIAGTTPDCVNCEHFRHKRNALRDPLCSKVVKPTGFWLPVSDARSSFGLCGVDGILFLQKPRRPSVVVVPAQAPKSILSTVIGWFKGAAE